AGDARAAIATGDLEKAGARLDWVMTQSRRLSTMLSGLLDYSSIGRKIEAMEQVDTLRLASDIRDGFPAGSRMCVTVEGTWPVIETVKAPLELVIRNLVENAAKHHDREAGRITLGCRETSDALWITVTDDGPGIAPSNWEAIFLPFRTLSATGAREDGIGLGLALVKRTLDSVGGNITLKSEANGTRGTQFDVMWPRFFKS
ncbi:MAG: sensor histidine kinase, partial [Gammaproteobacteria bacterium]